MHIFIHRFALTSNTQQPLSISAKNTFCQFSERADGQAHPFDMIIVLNVTESVYVENDTTYIFNVQNGHNKIIQLYFVLISQLKLSNGISCESVVMQTVMQRKKE